jgi:hypothetical protein
MDAHDLAPMDHSDADSGHPATVEEEDVDEKSHLEVTADCRCARLVVLNPVDPAVLYASDFFTSTTADSFITFQPLRV